MGWLRDQIEQKGQEAKTEAKGDDEAEEDMEKVDEYEHAGVLSPGVLFPGGLKELYVRPCYRDIFKLILDRYNEGRQFDGVVVTGNPGIGKSSFLSYALTCLAALKIRVVFESTSQHKAWLFDFSKDDSVPQVVDTDDTKVQVAFKNELADRNTVFLFDTDADCPREPIKVEAFTIIAASPNKKHFKVFRDRTQPSRTLQLYMPVWILAELLDCHHKTTLYNGLSTDDVTSGFNNFGGIPRYVMSAGKDRKDLHSRLKGKLEICSSQNIMESEGRSDPAHHSHMLLRYEDVGDTPYEEVVITFASPYVFEQLAEIWEKDDELAMEGFVRQTAGVSELGGARGYALERVAHRKLAQGGKFKVRRLHEDGSKADSEVMVFKKLPTVEFDKFEEINVGEAYGKPKSKSFAVADAVSFRVVEKKTDGFQMTTSYDHSPKHQRVKELLDAAGIKKGDDIFRLFFVVPEDKFDNYKFQKYRKKEKGFMEANGVVKQVHQWVLLMPVGSQGDEI